MSNLSRICISINNRCNLKCPYCHFREKREHIEKHEMDVLKILSNMRQYIKQKQIELFKVGFVGNGEPLLDFPLLKSYILAIDDLIENGIVQAYTITNGTLINEDNAKFFKEHKINLGVSLDGPAFIHNAGRSNSFDKCMKGIECFRKVNQCYPTLNATVGQMTLEHADDVIEFFSKFNVRITFSRMIGEHHISLDDYHKFLKQAARKLNVRIGGLDCTMYGGKCAAGLDNIFFANNKAWICGNCVDLQAIADASTPFDLIRQQAPNFDRTQCFHDLIKAEQISFKSVT